MRRKQQPKQAAGGQRPRALRQDIARDFLPGEPAGGGESRRYSRVQVRAADVAESVNHCQDDQAKGKSDADVGDGAVGGTVDDDGARSGEDQRKSPQKLRHQPFGVLLRPSTIFTPMNEEPQHEITGSPATGLVVITPRGAGRGPRWRPAPNDLTSSARICSNRRRSVTRFSSRIG